MAGIPVKKLYYQKIPVPGLPAPTLNKYSDACQKNYMPQTVRVLPKSKVLKAMEIALKKGGSVSKNEEILKLCVEKNVKELNSDNLCCVSHRWTTCEQSVKFHVETLKQVLNYACVCSEETCYEEKNFYYSISRYLRILRNVVVHALKGKDDEIEKLLEFLKAKVSLIGLCEKKASASEDDLDLNEAATHPMVSLAGMQLDYAGIVESFEYEDARLETISRYLLYICPPGVLTTLKEADIDKFSDNLKELMSVSSKRPEDFIKSLKAAVETSREKLLPKTKDHLMSKRLSEANSQLDQLLKLPGLGGGFNGQDPVAMATLALFQMSTFEFFWIDVFCTPQNPTDIDATLKAVKDGMAVFSKATVVIAPPFHIGRLADFAQLNISAIAEKGADLREYYLKYPSLTLNDKMFLLSDTSYFDRMWTLHEMAIGNTLIYWWQYILGPFFKFTPQELTFKIDSMYNNAYKSGLDLFGYGTQMSRSVAVSTLRQHGPGDSLSTLFQTNFTAMQTSFSLDWDCLASSIFNLLPNVSVSDQILWKKMNNYSTYLLQYSPPNKKYSYAWSTKPEDVNHTFKVNKNKEVVAGCVEEPPESTKPAHFKLANKKATLDGKPLLEKCEAYKAKSLTKEGFFEPLSLHPLYYAVGLRKEELDAKPTPGYVILGEWKLPASLANKRKEAADQLKQHMKDPKLAASYKMMLDWLTPVQKVMILKSADPKHDFTLIYGVIDIQSKGFRDTLKQSPLAKEAIEASDLKSVEFVMP